MWLDQKKAIFKLDFFFQLKSDLWLLLILSCCHHRSQQMKVKFMKCCLMWFFRAVKHCIWFQSDTSLWKAWALLSSSLKKVSNSSREWMYTLGVQRDNRDDGEGRGREKREGRWFRGRAAPRAALCLAKSRSLSIQFPGQTRSWAASV